MTQSLLVRQHAPFERGPRVALSLLILSAVAFSLCLLAVQFLLPSTQRSEFLLQNTLAAGFRRPLFALLGGAAGLPLLLFAPAWLLGSRRGRSRSVERFADRWATLLCPLMLAFWVPVLFELRLSQSNPLMYLVMLSAFALVAPVLFARAFEELSLSRRPRWLSAESRLGRLFGAARARLARVPLGLGFVALSGLSYAVYGAYHAVTTHRLIQTTAFDIGLYDNLMFNALEGRWLRAPLLFGSAGPNFAGTHAEYAMLLFLPFYALKPHAETLLLLQAAAMGLAVVPLYLTAVRFLSRAVSLLVALSYLMFAAVHGVTFSDFHWLPFAVFFEFWLFYAIAAQKNWLAALTLLVLCALREDVALGTAFLGLFLALTGARVRLGWILAGVSMSWFVLNNFVLMPRLAAVPGPPGLVQAQLFADASPTLANALVTLFTNPLNALVNSVREAKVQYALHFLAPLAFLPVRRPALLLLLVPAVLLSLTAASYWPATPSAFQFSAQWIAYVFLAAVLGLWLMNFEPRGTVRRAAAVCTLGVVLLGHSYCFGGVLQRHHLQRNILNVLADMTPDARARYDRLMSLVRKIPAAASVAASDYLVPHVSARREVRSLRQEITDMDYVLVSSLEIHGENQRKLALAVERHPYGLVGKAGEFYLLKRGQRTADTDAAFRELGIGGTATSGNGDSNSNTRRR